jgi:general secretion pathway protein C
MLSTLDSSIFHRSSVPLARLALVVALLLAGFAALRLLGTAMFGPPIEAPPPVVLEGAGANLPEPAQSVANWHLFGSASAPIDLARLAQAAPATPLKLTLRGTLNENAPEGGIAIIADETGTDRAYRVGETLPGDAKLEGVYAGRVLLSRGGVNESLGLPSETAAPLATGAQPPKRGLDPALAHSLGAGLPGSQQPAPFVAPRIAPGGPSLESFRDNLGTDPAELAKQVQILPVIENGRMTGVRLSVGRDSDLLARAGLRPSDIVTAVNGIPLDGPQRSAELMATLKDARRVQITVRRDGQDVQLAIGL